jgi:hypothetical protein
VPTYGFVIGRPLNCRMEIILLVPGHVRSGLVHRAPTQPAPCRASSLKSKRRSAAPIPWRRFWAAASERESPARDELPCPTIEPGGPLRHAEASADQPRPGMPPESDWRSTHPYGADQPAGHRRRVRNPTRHDRALWGAGAVRPGRGASSPAPVWNARSPVLSLALLSEYIGEDLAHERSPATWASPPPGSTVSGCCCPFIQDG